MDLKKEPNQAINRTNNNNSVRINKLFKTVYKAVKGVLTPIILLGYIGYISYIFQKFS